ncbi:PepSY-associated TM helix domain-containing protein [Bacteroides cellulosilyticus]|uniref:PepSY domain protein n=1 Tax=Bacteroides cellulosilyticus DSM 14838 TaxID=537012 RepID=E2NA57_9BACE|nr:PepSY-associated TM helix domain-containing protein [Bacteroides cellulosilyticus]EEF91187.1 PepSY domain protein [Bacteroides cellulosilyticus DSM 14838]MBN9708293.1 PepSY domain-containing protein [Bacteroides cellulosilyticus]MDC7307507.1 PepSY domain-containing protein [Bacteroides cellulosilyticus DSM 14838]
MRKIFRNIHLWLSVPFGILITLICFSGAALVFEKEVMELCHRELYFVKKVEAAPLPMEQLMTKVAATLPDSVSVTGVNISSDPERAYQVTLSKPRRASMYVDQYTGEITGKYERAPFFNFMFRMHRWLLDSMKQDGGIFWGKMIVGTSTLMFVFVLISGVVVWWPRTRKALKNSLKIVANKGWRRFWYDLHVAGGMYALVFLLAMALTGLTWSFQWYRTGFYKTFGVEVQPSMGHGNAAANATAKGGKRDGKPEGREGRGAHRYSPYTNWQQVYEQLAEANPDYKQISVSDGSASVAVPRFGNQRGTDRYKFNPRNGEITETTLYKDLDNSGKIRGWIYSVHVGSWGGMLTRILTFAAALIGASLPLTGYYLWIRKKIKRRPASPKFLSVED